MPQWWIQYKASSEFLWIVSIWPENFGFGVKKDTTSLSETECEMKTWSINEDGASWRSRQPLDIVPSNNLKKFFFNLFTYLATPGLSSLVATCKLFNCSMWDLVPWPGIDSRSPALGVQSLSHWTIREDPHWTFEEGWVSRPDLDSDSTHLWIVFYVYVNCFVVVCGSFHCLSSVFPILFFFFFP